MLGAMKSRLIVSAVACALAVTGCSGSDSEEPSPTQTGEASEIVQLHPLTGEDLPDGRPEHPVFVVKIDDTPPAAPQYGLQHADMIVEQLVEGGLTRLAVMYYSKLPSKIGHVRSMRITDIGIAAPVQGHIVASGGAQRTIRQVQRAGIDAHLEDLDGTGFSGDPSRGRPYNRMLDLKTLAEKVGSATVEGSYFEFGRGIAGLSAGGTEAASADATPLAKSTKSARVRFSDTTVRTFAFRDGSWVRTNGIATSGGEFAADNLIVIEAPVEDAGYRDPSGAFVPETVFSGEGKAWIAEGDQYLKATWSKRDRDSVLTFRTSDGQPVSVKPGRTWIALIPDTGSGVNFS